MISIDLFQSALIFLLGFLCSIGGFFISFRLAKKMKFYDIADGDELKIHKTPIPLTGGFVVFGVLILIAVAAVLLRIEYSAILPVILAGMAFPFLLGWWDDVKWKHISQASPYRKFFLLLAVPLCSALLVSLLGLQFISFPFFAGVIIIAFFIFVCMNALNYQDGMDGLAGGLCFLSFLGFGAMGILAGDGALSLAAISGMGALAGFLACNLPPAKVFLGDSGSYMLGCLLALLGMRLVQYAGWEMLLATFLIIGIPIIEGIYTNIRRLRQGKSIFRGDRSHIYDRLRTRYSTRKVLLIHYGAQSLCIICGVALAQYLLSL